MKHRDARKRLRGNWMPAIFIWLVRLAIWTFPLLLEQLLSLLLDADTGNAFLGGAFLDDLSLWPYAAALLWSAVLDLVLFSPPSPGTVLVFCPGIKGTGSGYFPFVCPLSERLLFPGGGLAAADLGNERYLGLSLSRTWCPDFELERGGKRKRSRILFTVCSDIFLLRRLHPVVGISCPSPLDAARPARPLCC